VRIVHAIRATRLTHGGPARSVLDLARALRGRGHEVTILTLDDSGLASERSTHEPIRSRVLRSLPGERGFLTPRSRREAREVLANADFLHLNEVWELFNVTLASMARQQGVRYCVSPRGSLDDWGFGRKRWRKRLFHSVFSRRMMEAADFVHCTADGERLQSQIWYPRGNTLVIPNLLDMEPFRNLPGPEHAAGKYGIPLDRPILLYMSRISDKKGLEHIIRAMPSILRERPTALLVIAGSGDPNWEHFIRQEVIDAGVESSVRFTGFVSGADKVSMLEAASVFLLPSSHENFGNVLFEAAACGARLVITRHIATWRELNAAGAARLVAQDPAEISEAVLDELSVSESVIHERRRAIRAWTLAYYGGDRIVSMYERCFAGDDVPASQGASR
jgi:glycosyltransferase involved in cell wall biosynthesis